MLASRQLSNDAHWDRSVEKDEEVILMSLRLVLISFQLSITFFQGSCCHLGVMLSIKIHMLSFLDVCHNGDVSAVKVMHVAC